MEAKSESEPLGKNSPAANAEEDRKNMRYEVERFTGRPGGENKMKMIACAYRIGILVQARAATSAL